MARNEQHERSDLLGLGGYGCLMTLSLAGFIGGSGLVFLGVSALLKASREQLRSGEDAYALVGSLEGAVALVGFGALALLVGCVASVVLLKELGDESSRRERGPVR